MDTSLWLSIDTGLDGGWALWRGHGPDEPPFACGVYGPHTKKGSYAERLYAALRDLRQQVEREQVCESFRCLRRAVLETPVFYDNPGGQAVAKRGDLLKLCWAVGATMYCMQSRGVSVFEAPVPRWKGQLSKEQVAFRIQSRLGKKALRQLKPKSHAWDAIGIGLWAKGNF